MFGNRWFGGGFFGDRYYGQGGDGPAELGEPEVCAIRRARVTMHLGDERRWIFYDRLTIDMEVGLGLTDGQGADPQVMLRYSDDRGQTWSHERWASAGRIGEYTRQVIFRQLGRAKDRVFEVVVSDPIPVHILDGYLKLRAH